MLKPFLTLLILSLYITIYSQSIIPNKIVFKLKPNKESLFLANSFKHEGLNQLLNKIQATNLHQKFIKSRFNEGYNEKLNKPFIDLRYIFEIDYKSNIPLDKIIDLFIQTNVIAYAQPLPKHKLLYTPNDYNSSTQDFIALINAPSAWNTQQGDTNVVIGITDTGTDWDHPDLIDNIKYNYSDPIDNIDNDNDGYTDNYRGWDLGVNDNDPMVQGSNHGAHVSGCAAASTDNNTGVASPAFKCKFLPIKIADAQGNLTSGYEGIVYGADQGCAVINCSWGSNFGGQLGQDIINYATINRNALVVAGAGNDNSEDTFYPAAYDNVLSVGASTSMDGKASFSNYGYTIDVSAPGVNIYSTNYNNTYSASSGTSMSSPIAAGAAAIVQSQFPQYSGIQIGEIIRVTADNIDNNLSNIHKGKMGTGRINMYSAVNNTSPSIRVIKEEITDNNNNTFMIGETIDVTPHYTNYLQNASGVVATLSCNSSYISILNGSISLGNINTNDTIIQSSPFKFEILNGINLNEKVQFKITISSGQFSFEEYFDVVVNVDFINVLVNDLSTTVTSRGMIGYNENNQTQGYGVNFDGKPLLFDAGLMLGVSGTQVSDNVRGMNPALTDEDFVSMINVYEINNGISDLDTRGKFNDLGAGVNKLSIVSNHYSYAWSQSPYNQFVILRFVIYNGSGVNMDGLHCGIFADWDIMDYSTNRADWIGDTKLGYAYSTEAQGLYGGVQLLSYGPEHYYAFNNDGTGGSMNIYDGFSESEKYTSMSNSLNQSSSGPNDVSMVVGSGPFNLSHGDSIQVSFALHAGYDLNDIKNSATAAKTLYDSLFYDPNAGFPVAKSNQHKIYPTAFKQYINLDLNDNCKSLRVFDLNGKLVFQSKQIQQNEVIYLGDLDKGYYNIELQFENYKNKYSTIIKL